MKYYDYPQRYLFESDFAPTPLSISSLSRQECDEIQDYKIPRNLFDYSALYRRKITVDALDKTVGTIEEFNAIVNLLTRVDELVLVDTYVIPDNPILRNYEENKLKAYVWLFKQRGIKQITVFRLTE